MTIWGSCATLLTPLSAKGLHELLRDVSHHLVDWLLLLMLTAGAAAAVAAVGAAAAVCAALSTEGAQFSCRRWGLQTHTAAATFQQDRPQEDGAMKLMPCNNH
jgi:hypothetical protein